MINTITSLEIVNFKIECARRKNGFTLISLKQLEQIKKDLERLEQLEEENQELKNKYEKLKTKYSNIRKYPTINQALMGYDKIDWEILKDEYGEEVLDVYGNDK